MEAIRLAAISAARTAARSAASDFSKERLRKFQQSGKSGDVQMRPRLVTLRDAPALLKQWREQQQQQSEDGPPPKTRVRPSTAPNVRLAFPHSGFSPWGFFACTLSDLAVEETVLRVGAPASHAGLPELVLTRPAAAEEKRLAFGPFAFRLSPSSEVLAWLALTMLHPLLKGKHVLELGSGLGLTGLAVGSWCECASIRLTDGDPTSFRAVRRNVELNAQRGAFGDTHVDACQLMWGTSGVASAPPAAALSLTAAAAEAGGAEVAAPPEQRQGYDVILAADCVYDRALHVPLCQTIRRWLAPNGVCVIVASRRCGSLADFDRVARGEFGVHAWPTPYDATVAARFKGAKCYPDILTLRHAARQR